MSVLTHFSDPHLYSRVPAYVPPSRDAAAAEDSQPTGFGYALWSCAAAGFASLAFVLGSGVTGTNANVRGANSYQPAYSPARASRLEDKEDTGATTGEILSVNEQLDVIKQTFKLSTSDLAHILGVSRPTVYNWAKGAEPSPDNWAHLRYLVGESTRIAALALHRPNLLLKRPIFDGRSVLDFFHDQLPLSDVHLQALASLDRKEQDTRSRRKGFGPVRDLTSVVEDESMQNGWDSAE